MARNAMSEDGENRKEKMCQTRGLVDRLCDPRFERIFLRRDLVMTSCATFVTGIGYAKGDKFAWLCSFNFRVRRAPSVKFCLLSFPCILYSISWSCWYWLLFLFAI